MLTPASTGMCDEPGSSACNALAQRHWIPAFAGMTPRMGGDDARLRAGPSMFFRRDKPTPILTPCIGICTLAADGLCTGCHRTGDEIARWASLDDAERARIMTIVLPEREARRAPLP